jgi:hypothetical protein
LVYKAAKLLHDFFSRNNRSMNWAVTISLIKSSNVQPFGALFVVITSAMSQTNYNIIIGEFNTT